jgi:nicotinamidase-related amidase
VFLEKRSALVVLDVQNGIFARPESLVHDAEGVLDRIDGLVQAAVARATRVVLVQDDAGPGLWRPETPDWELHERLTRPPAAIFLRKTYGDAFRATDLDTRLRHEDVGSLVIVGAMTDFSVRATLQRALLKGYAVSLVADAHSTLDAPDGPAENHIELLNQEVRDASDRGLPARLLAAGDARLIV